MLNMDAKDCLKILATGCAGVFSGAAFYINAADHPARMTALTTENNRKAWSEGFKRAKRFQMALSVTGSAAAGAVYYLDKESDNRLLWLVGGGLFSAVIPYTFIFMIPDILKNLKDDAIDTQGESWVRDHLCRWNKQHAVRTLLVLTAFDVFMYALLKN